MYENNFCPLLRDTRNRHVSWGGVNFLKSSLTHNDISTALNKFLKFFFNFKPFLRYFGNSIAYGSTLRIPIRPPPLYTPIQIGHFSNGCQSFIKTFCNFWYVLQYLFWCFMQTYMYNRVPFFLSFSS